MKKWYAYFYFLKILKVSIQLFKICNGSTHQKGIWPTLMFELKMKDIYADFEAVQWNQTDE